MLEVPEPQQLLSYFRLISPNNHQKILIENAEVKVQKD